MTVPNKLTRGAVITEELKTEIERRYNEFESVQAEAEKWKRAFTNGGTETMCQHITLLRNTLQRIANRFDLGNGKCAGAAEQHTYDEAMRVLADTEETR